MPRRFKSTTSAARHAEKLIQILDGRILVKRSHTTFDHPLCYYYFMDHGTHSMYVAGCRCKSCKKANTDYGREYRARRAAGHNPVRRVAFCHGTLSAYTNDLCRCVDCRKAWRIYQAAHHRANKTTLLAKSAERYERNKGQRLVKKKARDQTPEGRHQSAKWAAARRARKLDSYVEDIDRDVLFEQHGGICGICSKPIEGKFEVDHIKPLSRGGEHSYANMQPAHPRCNRKKHAKVIP